MQVKKYKAKNMPEAMTKIRSELGEDAVILNSKYVDSGGFFGFFTKKSIEVIAAKDEAPAPPGRRQENEKTEPKKSEPPAFSAKPKEDLQAEVQELKQMVASISDRNNTSSYGYPAPVQEIETILKDQEVEEALIYELLKDLLSDWYRRESEADETAVKEWAKAHIEAKLPSDQMGPAASTARMINLVGPTGVGKTTSAAKIAAYYHLEEKQSVAFITTDTYRIAAVQQLETYAKILDIPIAVVYSMEDFKEAKERFADVDLILVDSAGRNFTNPLYVRELQKIIDFEDEIVTYLVLSLTSKYKDMKTIYEQFSLISIDRFLFTKKDETSSFGAMFNMMARTGTGTAYITHGQSVPDDIEPAAAGKIKDWIIEEPNDE